MSFYQISEIEAQSFDSTNKAMKVAAGDAGVFRISAIGGDAGKLSVSAVQSDAGLAHVSAYQGDANNLHVSAVQSDAALQRVSAVNPYGYTSITTSAQTLVKSGAGTLHGVAVTANNISSMAFYDNTVSGGTTIFTLPTSAMNVAPFFQFDTNFTNGLFVSSGSSNTNIVVSYK